MNKKVRKRDPAKKILEMHVAHAEECVIESHLPRGSGPRSALPRRAGPLQHPYAQVALNR